MEEIEDNQFLVLEKEEEDDHFLSQFDEKYSQKEEFIENPKNKEGKIK
jgi:hypothetical protein